MAFITYMRTDSTRLSEEALEGAKSYIISNYGESLSKIQQYGQKKANTQDAHEAIRPTYPDLDPRKASKVLSADQAKVYELIWKRFIASQMVPAKYLSTKIKIQDMDNQRFIFEAEGSVCVEEGYELVYQPQTKEKNIHFSSKPGQPTLLQKLEKTQNFTTPPPRLTEASLVKKLEKEGIGRPSTYASIIHTLLERNYATKEQKSLVPTFLGMVVNHFMSDFFPKIIQTKFTATMEEKLDDVEEGHEDWKKTIDGFYSDFEPSLSKVKDKLLTKTLSWNFETNLRCLENDSHFLSLKMGRYGPYLRCETCDKNTSISETAKIIFRGSTAEIFQNESHEINREDARIGRQCPKCGSELVEKNGRFGKFIACSNYPKCKYTENIDILAEGKCPKCGAPVLQKKTKRGRLFYTCKNSSYSGGTCDFISWYEPADGTCAKCGKALFIKRNSRGEATTFCPECSKDTKSAKKKTK
jgi:DNA topoisomerase-1